MENLHITLKSQQLRHPLGMESIRTVFPPMIHGKRQLPPSTYSFAESDSLPLS
jgi:hypothetical protein